MLLDKQELLDRSDKFLRDLFGDDRKVKGKVFMRKINILLLIGLFLFSISAYPLFLHVRELIVSNMAHNQYDLNPIYDQTQVQFYGNEIVLIDPFSSPSEEYQIGSVDIKVNGTDYSHSANVEIRPTFHDSNRYHNYLRLIELIDKQKNTSMLAIIQRISGIETPPYHEKEFEWRLLLVARDGSVTEEVFKYGEQSDPIYRGMLVNYASPIGIGYYSNVLHVYPTFFYPIIYPYATGVISILLLFMGKKRTWRFFNRR